MFPFRREFSWPGAASFLREGYLSMKTGAPTVSFVFSIIGALLSITPWLLLLSARAIESYREGLEERAWFRAWAGRANRLVPGPGVAVGLVAGCVSAALALLISDWLIPNYQKVVRPQSALTMTIQIAFVYAGAVEELAKTGMCLVAVAWVSRTRPGAGSPVQSQLGLLPSTPFVCGAVGLGFALIENQLYLEGIPVAHFGAMLAARGGVSAVVHTVITVYFGVALLELKRGSLTLGILRAMVLCALFHGIFDFFALSPEPMPQFLALAFLIGLVAMTLLRLRRLLPELRRSPWVPATERAERDKDSAPDALDPGLLLAVVRDGHALERPSMHPPPFWPEEYPIPPGLHRRLFAESAERAPPTDVSGEWSRREAELLRAAGRYGFHYRIFDSAVFAEAPTTSYQQLHALGLDLTAVHPLRVIELGPAFDREYAAYAPDKSPGESVRAPQPQGGAREIDRYVYTTLGLSALYGREVWVSFPHLFPGLRLLLLHLAGRAAAAGSLADFRTVRMHPMHLGDLTGVFRGFAVVPLLDPIREAFLADRVRAVPAELLLLSERELELADEHGVPALLGVWKRAGIPWANDYRRVAGRE